MTPCRFVVLGCSAPAVVRVALSAGCVCFRGDRVQVLCAHHWGRSEPIGELTVIERYDETPPALSTTEGPEWPLRATLSDQNPASDHPRTPHTPKRRVAASTVQRLEQIHEHLDTLAEHPDALLRSAARLALAELRQAGAADDPGPHLAQAARILDAVLNPVSEPNP